MDKETFEALRRIMSSVVRKAVDKDDPVCEIDDFEKVSGWMDEVAKESDQE